MKRSISKIFLLSIFLLNGCTSFYQIDTKELPEISNEDVIQIKFDNGDITNIDSVQYANITTNQELEIIKYSSTTYNIDSVRTLYPLNQIKEIRIKKFDPQKSTLSFLWISAGIAFVLLAVFTIIYGPLKYWSGELN